MKHLHLILLLALAMSACQPMQENTPNDTDENTELELLKDYIARKSEYDSRKEERIAALEQDLVQTTDRYGVLNRMFDEYQSYDFDRAILCVERLYDEALLLGDKDKIVDAEVKKGFSYLSAGLFKESYDLFERMDTTGASVRTRADYCLAYARMLYDLAVYNHVGMSHAYNQEGTRLMHEALGYFTPQDTLDYWNCAAIIDQHEGFYERSIGRFKLALEDSKANLHQQAINLSTIAHLYLLQGDKQQQRHYNILAAIKDIESSTKEAVAMRIVADILYKEGNVHDAGICIRCAQEDAVFYNARHRQVEISQILPIIEEENIRSLEKQKHAIILLMIIIVVLLCICIWEIRMLRRRNRKLRKARETISEINQSLLLANRIKEEYIGSFLCWQSDFIVEIDKYQRQVKKLAMRKQFEELLEVPKSIDAQRKREDFYKRFDEIFLHIFPDFVSHFNALLRPDEQIVLREGELLNTDLRIFALIRLGVTHNEVIAQMLNYSVNTIYSYKTKVKNRSDLSNDRFLEAVMQIPSFKQEETEQEDA